MVSKGVVTMDRPMNDFWFRLMSLEFKLRDKSRPPKKILREVGIKPGQSVLDYGCGPGGFSIAAARLVGESGIVYGLDIHPLAVQNLQYNALRKGIVNVETIRSGSATGLPDNSIDVVLLYDILHDLSDPNGVLEELHRVLKPGGILSLADKRLKEDEIFTKLKDIGLFSLARKGERTYSFSKE